MHIKDKIFLNREGLEKEGPITIVAFGDSVTHGAVGAGEMDYETVYWNLLKRKILSVKNYVPVNVICAGIGGTDAKGSVCRLESQVLKHEPDLVIVCFGLNDVNGELEDYLSSLKTIFEKIKRSGSDIIFMTPNMLNTYVSEKTEAAYMDYAAVTADYQTGGKMDLFMKSAVELAEKMDVSVCDCYAKWKELSETCDTTELLANYINHPLRQMHKLFSDMLFDIIFKDVPDISGSEESAMYKYIDSPKGDN